MSYFRVLPRDAFNEANLLKCIAQLTMLIEDGFYPRLAYEYDGEAFQIEQSDAGYTYVVNIQFYLDKNPISIVRPVNSREPWPLYWENDDTELSPVFDDAGNFVLYVEGENDDN